MSVMTVCDCCGTQASELNPKGWVKVEFSIEFADGWTFKTDEFDVQWANLCPICSAYSGEGQNAQRCAFADALVASMIAGLRGATLGKEADGADSEPEGG